MTCVSLLLTLSPSYRDFHEKKELLHDIESVHRPVILKDAMTGMVMSGTKPVLSKESHGKETDIKPRKKSSSATNTGSKNKEVERNRTVEDHTKRDKVPCMDTIDSSSYMVAADDYLEPLPPPVAPTYKPDVPCDEIVINKSSERLRMMSIDTADFPGIYVNVEASRSNESLSDQPEEKGNGVKSVPASAPVEEGEHHSEQSYHASLQFFNYLKNINKVVSASKKKGRQVMEKIAVSTNPGFNKDSMILELEGQVAKLDKKNNKLQKENEFLREQNMRLIQENMGLKLSLNGGENDGYLQTTCDDSRSEATESIHSIQSSQTQTEATEVGMSANIHIEKLDSPTKENRLPWNEPSEMASNVVPPTCDDEAYSPKNSLDDPFFQHMATLNDETSNPWDKKMKSNETSRKPLAPTTTQQQQQQQDQVVKHFCDRANVKRSESPKVLVQQYPDSLFAHMAQMNRDW
jgi:hypothetical protein